MIEASPKSLVVTSNCQLPREPVCLQGSKWAEVDRAETVLVARSGFLAMNPHDLGQRDEHGWYSHDGGGSCDPLPIDPNKLPSIISVSPRATIEVSLSIVSWLVTSIDWLYTSSSHRDFRQGSQEVVFPYAASRVSGTVSASQTYEGG